MTRKKLKLLFIANDSSRKATFKKRKKGLLKKVKELSTLCGINACAIIYSPYDASPEVWPSHSGVQRIASEFRDMPVMDQQKKMVDQKTFLEQRIAKASEHLRRERKEAREREMTEVLSQCLIGNIDVSQFHVQDLNDLCYLIIENLKIINRWIEILEGQGAEIGESSNASAAVDPSEGVTSLPFATAPAAAAANFFNSIQHLQQQQQQFPPHAGLYEQPQNQNHPGLYEQPQNQNHPGPYEQLQNQNHPGLYEQPQNQNHPGPYEQLQNQNHAGLFEQPQNQNHGEQVRFPFPNYHQNRNDQP